MTSHFNFIFLILIWLPSFAGVNKVGNGGNGVYCTNPNSAQLLDFYEEKVTLTTSQTDPKEIAESQFLKLKTVAPKLADVYLKRISQISNEIDYRDNIALTDVPDSNHLFKPVAKNCDVIQTAIRKNKIAGNEKRFIIRSDLWKQLSPLHQAGLLTHEIIYEHLSKMGEKDSVKARKLNRYIYQNKIDSIEFWQFIKDLQVSIYP